MNRAKAPFHVMVKPIGAQCNLRCDYCFYLGKASLYPDRKGSAYRMRDETLDLLVRSVIDSRAVDQDEVVFSWQGGEPSLMGLPFFEKAVALQKCYAPPGVRVANTFQTNGTLLDDDYARFFREHRFLVGLSIDGPQALHDRFRRDAAGHGSFKAVMTGIETLRRHGVEYNLMVAVQSDNACYPDEVYGFLSRLGSAFIQFIPIVEPDPLRTASERSVTPEQWGEFLVRVFHLWRRHDVGKVFIQHFDMLLGLTLGRPATLCVHAPTCGRALAMEHNGDLYSCDHFVDRAHFLGNFAERRLGDLAEEERQRNFGLSKFSSLPEECRQCPELRLCHGGCPKDRLIHTRTGRLNWLCQGYRRFYRESAPYFLAMALALQHRLPASAYVRFLHGEGAIPPSSVLNAGKA